jgi:hypothetical protein
VERYRAAQAEVEGRVKEAEKELAGIPKEEKEKQGELKRRIEELKKAQPPMYAAAMGVREEGTAPPATHVLVRGNARQQGPEVKPGYPGLLASMEPALPAAARSGKSSGRRRVLAEWIADAANPLTARVLANRLWQFHFGRGIVRSPSDFGVTGDPPTHPELLDWLASELVEGGWKLKRLHRLIMNSSAYRMSSRHDPRAAEADPANDLFWRFDLRRLEAEAIRDAILAASGLLDLEAGGPSVFPEIPREVLHGQSRPGEGWQTSELAKANRRSVYVFVKRSVTLPILEAFDAADTGQTCSRRNVTTIAPQALTLLNSGFATGAAAAFADRLLREAGKDAGRQVECAYRLALGRPPSEEEAGTALSLLADQCRLILAGAEGAAVEDPEGATRRALATLCLVLFNLNEFVYID